MWLWERARLVTVAMENALHKGESRKKLTWRLRQPTTGVFSPARQAIPEVARPHSS